MTQTGQKSTPIWEPQKPPTAMELKSSKYIPIWTNKRKNNSRKIQFCWKSPTVILLLERCRRDSNPRALTDQRISRPCHSASLALQLIQNRKYYITKHIFLPVLLSNFDTYLKTWNPGQSLPHILEKGFGLSNFILGPDIKVAGAGSPALEKL